MRSPSGQFSSSIYKEVDKDVCSRSRTDAPPGGPHLVRVRPSRGELPMTFAAPRASAPDAPWYETA